MALVDTDVGNIDGMELTATEAAPIARRSARTLRYLASHGRILGVRKFGGIWVFPADAVRALPAPRRVTNNRRTAA